MAEDDCLDQVGDSDLFDANSAAGPASGGTPSALLPITSRGTIRIERRGGISLDDRRDNSTTFSASRATE
jgi:hypothetical protein